MAYTTSEEGRQGLPDLTAIEIADIIKRRFLGAKRNPRPTPILMIGKSGVGKTEIVYQAVKELGIGLKEVVLTEYENTDLAGLPRPMERDDIEGITLNNQSDMYIVEHIRPRLLPDPVKANHAIETYRKMNNKQPGEPIDIMDIPPEGRKYAAGILFFDEVSAACRENRIAASKLLDKSRRIGDYILPDYWLVICACNGPEDGGAYDDLEGMFFNRCQGMRFEPEENSWLSWATQNNVMPSIIAFIKAYPDMLWDLNMEEQMYTSAFPSPRAWTNASIELMDFIESKPENYHLTERDIYINIGGIVGTQAATKFATFYAYNDAIIPVAEIEAGTARTNVNDGSREANYLQASIVATHLNKLAEEYNTATLNKDFTKIKNTLNWIGKFANANLDAGIELLREAIHWSGSPTYILLLANFQLITQICPDFVQFYNDHKTMFQYS